MMNTDMPNGRLERSVRALLAFYGRKLQTALELLSAGDAQSRAGETTDAGGASGECRDDLVEFGPDLLSRGLRGVRAGRTLTIEERADLAQTFSTILSTATLTSIYGAEVGVQVGAGESTGSPAGGASPFGAGGASPFGTIDWSGGESADDSLKRFETKLRIAHAAPASNVISMVPARRKRDFPAGFVVGPAAKRTLKKDCLIEASDVREVHKLAFELHSRGDRLAFLRLSEFDEGTRTCFTSLLNLGPITLFVPEIMGLSEAEQTALATLTDFYWQIRPLVIIGSRNSLAELRANPSVNQELLKTLTRSHLQLFGAMNRTQDLDPWLDQLEREDA